jgi:hypothetical protein
MTTVMTAVRALVVVLLALAWAPIVWIVVLLSCRFVVLYFYLDRRIWEWRQRWTRAVNPKPDKYYPFDVPGRSIGNGVDRNGVDR